MIHAENVIAILRLACIERGCRRDNSIVAIRNFLTSFAISRDICLESLSIFFLSVVHTAIEKINFNYFILIFEL